MIRLVVSVFLTVVLVAFAMSNTHTVQLSFIMGGPVKLRLIFLLMTAFLMGMAFLGFFMMVLRLRMRQLKPVPVAKPAEPADEEDLLEA